MAISVSYIANTNYCWILSFFHSNCILITSGVYKGVGDWEWGGGGKGGWEAKGGLYLSLGHRK